MKNVRLSRRRLLVRLAEIGLAETALQMTLSVAVPSFSYGQATPKLGVFGYLETPKPGLQPFPKWNEVLKKYLAEANAAKACVPAAPAPCPYAAWTQFVAGQKGKPAADLLKAVNDFLNQAPYVVDMVNWGLEDYWASPGEFFVKFGDCEDYAVAKFLTLRALDVPSSALRIVAVQDLNLKVGHAILAAYVGEKVFILDNQIKPVAAAETIRHYAPMYSVNEESWWLHSPPPK